jgi:hypothetical protein
MTAEDESSTLLQNIRNDSQSDAGTPPRTLESSTPLLSKPHNSYNNG